MSQIRIPAVYTRGGTSKGVFFLSDDLPADPEVRDRLLLRVIGSPDRYGKHIDGMGGATLTAMWTTCSALSRWHLHHAMTGTGALALAAVAAIPGTVVREVSAQVQNGQLCFGHPSGSLRVGAEIRKDAGQWLIDRVSMSRSARILMEGWVEGSALRLSVGAARVKVVVASVMQPTVEYSRQANASL